MLRYGDLLTTLKADLRQQIQLLRARVQRMHEGPLRRPAARRPEWEESASWSGDDAGPPPSASPNTPSDGLMSRPRTVHEATERLQSRRSLIRRQRTRRPL